MLSEIKNGIFSVGIDDAIHKRGGKKTELFFIYCRGQFLEKISHTPIEVDGFDATEAIIHTLKPQTENFALIVTHGLTVGGFNLIDIEKVNTIVKRPIIAVTENKPTGDSILNAIKNLSEYKIRKDILDRAGPLYSVQTKIGSNRLYFHIKGINELLAKKFLKKFSIRSRLPEQVLLAHKIASGWK